MPFCQFGRRKKNVSAKKGCLWIIKVHHHVHTCIPALLDKTPSNPARFVLSSLSLKSSYLRTASGCLNPYIRKWLKVGHLYKGIDDPIQGDSWGWCISETCDETTPMDRTPPSHIEFQILLPFIKGFGCWAVASLLLTILGNYFLYGLTQWRSSL